MLSISPLSSKNLPRPPLTIHLCAPRGFCAGVERAIQIVELAILKYGAPVYVRHQIVHNRHVVEMLEAQGAVFVEELDEVPSGDRPVIFSAHGVPASVPHEAKARHIIYIDATCPLVSKVHMEARHLYKNNYQILLVGHAGHPEVIGTMGQVPEGAITLIETPQDAENFTTRRTQPLAIITQTTLSVDDASCIIEILKSRFPDINTPHKDDICYATTNRQNSVKKIASLCDIMFVIGAPNSSNSQRLRQVAEQAGCGLALLIQDATEIDWDTLPPLHNAGLTAGASAPETLVQNVLKAFQERYDVTIQTPIGEEENVYFNLPQELRSIRKS